MIATDPNKAFKLALNMESSFLWFAFYWTSVDYIMKRVMALYQCNKYLTFEIFLNTFSNWKVPKVASWYIFADIVFFRESSQNFVALSAVSDIYSPLYWEISYIPVFTQLAESFYCSWEACIHSLTFKRFKWTWTINAVCLPFRT